MALSGFNTRRDSKSDYLRLDQLFAPFRGVGINPKAAATSMLSAGKDLSDIFDPSNSALDRINFNTGFKVNAITNSPDLQVLYRSINISPTPSVTIAPTPTPTPTPSLSVGQATITISGEQVVRWYPNPILMTSTATSTTSITLHTIEVRSGLTTPPTGPWSVILTSNPAATNSTKSVNYTPNQGPGYYQFRAAISDGGGPRTPVTSGVVNIISNATTVDISSTTPTLGTFGPITITSNAASNNTLANLKAHGVEWFNGSYWQNISNSAINVQSNKITPVAPSVSSYGTYFYRAYTTNCNDSQQVGTYQYTNNLSVTYAAVPIATYTLNVSQSPAGSSFGTVTGGGTFNVDGVATRAIVATPNTANGYAFSTWTGDTGYLQAAANVASNSVLVPTAPGSGSVNLVAVFVPAVATSPTWLNTGFVAPDSYSTTIISKIFNGTVTSFNGTIQNPNAYTIYVNTTDSNTYGISFGGSQNNAAILANNTSTWTANYNGNITYSDTPLTASLIVNHNGNLRPFYAVLPGSVYLTNANLIAPSSSQKYAALDQSITTIGKTGIFTLNNPNPYPVTVTVSGIQGAGADARVIRWYLGPVVPANLLSVGSSVVIPIGGTEDIYWVADAWFSSPYVYQTRQESKITFTGINTNVSHRIISAERSYNTVGSVNWSAWLNARSVWQADGGGQINFPNTAYSLFRAWQAPVDGIYTFQQQADDECVTYIDDVFVLQSYRDYVNVSPTQATMFLNAGMHIIHQDVTNNSGGTKNNPAGFNLDIFSPSMTLVYNSRFS